MPIIVNGLPYADEEEMGDFPLRDGLTWKQKKDAEFLYTVSRGVMLVTGEPGGGKDLFSTGISALNKAYFGRRILLDFLPKVAFGEYVPFNVHVMIREINKMAKMAGIDFIGLNETSVDHIGLDKASEEKANKIGDMTQEWATSGEGEALLQGAVLYLSELKRYCHNRNPHNPVNKFVGAICSQWRHLDLLIIGTHIFANEIDVKGFLQYVTHRARCTWSMTRPDTSKVVIDRGKFIVGTNVYDVEGKPVVYYVNGNKPLDILDGKKIYDMYVTKSKTNLKPVLRRDLK